MTALKKRIMRKYGKLYSAVIHGIDRLNKNMEADILGGCLYFGFLQNVLLSFYHIKSLSPVLGRTSQIFLNNKHRLDTEF